MKWSALNLEEDVITRFAPKTVSEQLEGRTLPVSLAKIQLKNIIYSA
jgi:hypothetical protein